VEENESTFSTVPIGPLQRTTMISNRFGPKTKEGCLKAQEIAHPFLNRELDMTDCTTILYMHLTKTAGGTLKDAFRRAYADDEIQFHYPDAVGFDASGNYGEARSVVFGHFIFGFHTKLCRPAQYVTILRKPGQRSISHFFHLRSADPSSAGDEARDCESFVQYIARYKRLEFDNFYVRVLSGIGDRVAFGEISSNHRDSALENLLKYFRFVGAFEQLPATTAELSRMLGRPLLANNTINKGLYEPVSLQDKLLALEVSVHDLYIYAAAKEIFSWPPD
jgi:hypothetical protein